jgi:hypothetical protein
MPTEADRHELRLALERELGRSPATTLMELFPPVDWSEFARRSDIAELRAEINELRVELKGEISELRADMKGQVTRLVVANIPIMFGTAGLVLAAAKLT